MKRVLTFFFLVSLCLYVKATATEPSSSRLDLRFMNLKTIELDSARAAVLTDFNVSGNPITSLPENLKYAKQLKSVKLNYCTRLEIASLEKMLEGLPIEELELENCNLVYLPMELAGIRTLKRISIKNNLIQELPWNLFTNTNLEYLNVDGNDLEALDKDIEKLYQLTYLNISNNPCLQRSDWWQPVEKLGTLKTLECSGAKKLPKEWSLSLNLEELVINDCRANFPEKILKCQQLKKLTVYNSPADADVILKALDARELTELKLSGYTITQIPDLAGEYQKLQTLEIEAVKLTYVSDKLSAAAQLGKLTARIADNASLAMLFKALANNNALEEVDLSNGKLKQLPDEISYVRSVRKLSLQGNALQNAGNGIYKLDKIEEMDLRGNTLSADEMAKLVKAFPQARLYYDQVLPAAPTSYIQKPFPALDLQPEKYTVNPAKDTVLVSSNGTRITIPANCIVDKKGKPVKEKTRLDYTTYYDPLAVYASGIPMTADSAGVKKSFASAGMFSLNATYGNNQSAYLKKGARVKIDFVSNSPNQPFKYWYLDTVKKNWVQTGQDNFVRQPPKRLPYKRYPRIPGSPYKIFYSTIHFSTIGRYSKKNNNPEFRIWATAPDNKNKSRDSICYYPSEMGVYGDKTWKYVGDSLYEFNQLVHPQNQSKFFKVDNFDKKRQRSYYTSQDEVEITIRPDKEKDCFVITFVRENDSISINAIPLISNNDPVRTQKTNRSLYEEYYKRYAGNETTKGARMKTFKKEYQAYKKRMQKYDALTKAYFDKNVSIEEYQELYNKVNTDELAVLNKSAASFETITRSMEITGFGTYNCDYFMRQENPIVSAPAFVNQDNNARIDVAKVTVIDLEENAYIEAAPGEVKLFANRNYWMFCKTSDNRVVFGTVGATNRSIKSVPVKYIQAATLEELRKQIRY